MTTQSPHLYERRSHPAARTGGDASGGGTEHGSPSAPRGWGSPRRGHGERPQTRLPWWAVALPVIAFATLLALLGGGSADASTAASGSGIFSSFAGLLTALGDLLRHLL